ncbi:MAG: 50S ribosomal protein L4 [Candidatus Levybacteria bacterium]|nr:50S ribosomal protein L4 [Candidatus Levybacteria bacterium]
MPQAKATKKPAKPVKKAVVKDLPKQTGLKLSVYNTSGRSTETITLPKEIFGVDINKTLMLQAVRVYLANQRRGTVKTKSRGEVNISTRKIYRQKGTGRARHGAASAPIFVGGGVALGPRQRDYSMKLTQKAKQKALFSAFSSKVKDGEIKLVAGLSKLEPKTKNMAGLLEKLQLNAKKQRLLVVTPKASKDFEGVVKASRNIEGVNIVPSNLLNTYEVLRARQILLMKEAIDVLKETFIK